MRQTVTWQVHPESFGVFSEADINWLRSSGLMIKIESPPRLSISDSGWCDASTGYEIITGSHEVFITTKTPEEETWVKLYWEDRAIAFEWTQYEINNLDNDFKGENENVID